MTVTLCDRCRKAYDSVNRGERDLVLRIVNDQVVRKRMSNGKIIDLCPNCYSELKQWLDSSVKINHNTDTTCAEVKSRIPKDVYESARNEVLDSGNQGIWTMCLIAIEKLAEFWKEEHEE